MAAPVPAKKAFELHNQLIDSDPEDLAALNRVVWKLRQLDRKLKDDFPTRVALQAGLVLVGDGLEARRLADTLFGRHLDAETDVLVTFAANLCRLGYYGRAKAIYTKFLDQPGIRELAAVREIAANTAVLSGDIEWMEQLVVAEEATNEPDTVRAILETLEESKLREYFPEHQRIVRDILGPHQCGCKAGISAMPGDDREIVLEHLLPMPRTERVDLQKQLRLALNAFFQGKGLSPSSYVTTLMTIVKPHPCGVGQASSAAA